MSTLHLVVGNVGSGKTTYTKRLYYNNFVLAGMKTFVINDDNLTSMLNNGQYEASYFTPEYWEVYIKVRKDMVMSLMETGYDIILDGWLPSRELRNDFIRLAEDAGYHVRLHVYAGPSNLQNRLENNRKQDPVKWKCVHEHFNKNYDAPTSDEGEIVYFDHKQGF